MSLKSFLNSNMLKNLLNSFHRGVKTTPPLHNTTASRKLAAFKKLQADFQVEDGRPVFLKKGIMDRGLYLSTLLACAAGLFLNLTVIYNHAKPESWKKKKD